MKTEEFLVTSNATDLSADGWLRIAAWGDHPNSVGLQRLAPADGEAMIAAFNSIKNKAANWFRGVPIYVGHPDRDPNRYPDKRRYGRVDALESRADGMYAKPAFNDIGQQVIEQGHYLYNSPVWALKREGNVVRPIELLSIGLTNEPNIKGEPWAKNEAEETPATNTTPNTEPPTPTSETPMTAEEKAQIESQLAALNTKIVELTAALAARDAETLAANASNAAALQSAAADLAAANAKLATERTARIELAANSIVATGRRTVAQRPALVAELTAANDLDAAIAAATAAKPALPTTSAVAGLGQRKAEGQKTAGVAINEAVRAYAAEHQCDLTTHLGYNLAWNGAKTKNPALFGVK